MAGASNTTTALALKVPGDPAHSHESRAVLLKKRGERDHEPAVTPELPTENPSQTNKKSKTSLEASIPMRNFQD